MPAIDWFARPPSTPPDQAVWRWCLLGEDILSLFPGTRYMIVRIVRIDNRVVAWWLGDRKHGLLISADSEIVEFNREICKTK